MGRKRTQEEYDIFLAEQNPTLKRISPYTGMDKKTEHKCLICGHEWLVLPSSITGKHRSGCPMCNGGTNTVIVGVNDMWTTNPEMAKLLADPEDGYRYTQSTSKKVKWKCPDCGEITKPKAISNVKNQGLTCSKCSSNKSLPNRIMYNLLSSLGVNFDDEIYFDWCNFQIDETDKYGVYDFYFEKDGKKYIVENDGYFHENDNLMNGQTADIAHTIDAEKDRLAIEHGINVIRIPCIPSRTDVIKNGILNSQLSKLFDLSSINWNECFYKSVPSHMKEICLDYENGNSITKLSKKYKKCIDTIRHYLQLGANAKICSYNGEDNKSPVVCLNDGKYFDMIKDASSHYNASTAAIILSCIGKAYNAGNSVDEFGLPLVFVYYKDYIKMSEFDKLVKIQQAVMFKYYDKMVMCENTKTVFKTARDAEKWCGSSIIGALHEPERITYSGVHPVTKERLKWKRIRDCFDISTLSYLGLGA